MDAKIRFIRDDKRSNIKRSPRSVGNPIPIEIHDRFNRIQHQIGINPWHTNTIIGIIGAFDIHIRSKKLNFSGVGTIGFHAFEHFNRILKHSRSRFKRNWTVRNNSSVVPPFIFRIIHDKHVIGKSFSKNQFIRIRFLFWVR